MVLTIERDFQVGDRASGVQVSERDEQPLFSSVGSYGSGCTLIVSLRTQPGLPIEKGRARTMTHDYVRNGTTTLFAAMNVLDGTVIGQNMQRHRRL